LATGNPTEVVEGLGRPPPVDIYIEDGRPGADGGYDPVSLTTAPGQTPKWHAGDAGIVIELGKVAVKVQNRGLLPALNVAVQCWVLAIGQHPDVPASWTLLSANSAAQTVNPGATVTFVFDALDGGAPLAGPRFVRASASCPADPSNLDPLAMLPMAGIATPVADLVANDNNLGLRELNFV
jgi:hypothetical protein